MINTTSKIREWGVCVCDKIMHNIKRETLDFYMETLNREKPREGEEEFTIVHRL